QLTRTTDVSCVVRITSESNPRATRLTARRSNGSALHTLDHQFSKSRAQKVRAQTPILPGGPTRVKGASLLNIRALDGLARRARPVGSPPVAAAPSSLLEILRPHGLDRHPLAGAAAGCPCRDARGNGSGAHRRGAVARVAERAREPAGTVGHRLLLLHRHHRLPLEPGGLSPSERRLFSIVPALYAL